MQLNVLVDDFNKIDEFYEVKRTLQVVIGDKNYRVNLLYRCCSDLSTPWKATVYDETTSGWKRDKKFPWVNERDEETAARVALRFLEDRHS